MLFTPILYGTGTPVKRHSLQDSLSLADSPYCRGQACKNPRFETQGQQLIRGTILDRLPTLRFAHSQQHHHEGHAES